MQRTGRVATAGLTSGAALMRSHPSIKRLIAAASTKPVWACRFKGAMQVCDDLPGLFFRALSAQNEFLKLRLQYRHRWPLEVCDRHTRWFVLVAAAGQNKKSALHESSRMACAICMSV